jgi:hypothetical protein
MRWLEDSRYSQAAGGRAALKTAIGFLCSDGLEVVQVGNL